MEDEDNVLYVRSAKNGSADISDDVWDDTALIKAYDKAVNLAKDEVAKRIGMKINRDDANKQNYRRSNEKACKKWKEGAPCRAVYSNDGQVYEAIVTKVNEKAGTCRVTFVGYGNVETVDASELYESEGLKSQVEQMRNCQDADVQETPPDSAFDSSRANASAEGMDFESEQQRIPKNAFQSGSAYNSLYGVMPPAPPLPPQLMSKLPENDADALSSMLMSWYISGFHTGYYHGIKQARRSEEKRKK